MEKLKHHVSRLIREQEEASLSRSEHMNRLTKALEESQKQYTEILEAGERQRTDPFLCELVLAFSHRRNPKSEGFHLAKYFVFRQLWCIEAGAITRDRHLPRFVANKG